MSSLSSDETSSELKKTSYQLENSSSELVFSTRRVENSTSEVVLTTLNCGGGISSTIKANYYKMGVANFVREKGKGIIYLYTDHKFSDEELAEIRSRQANSPHPGKD